MSRLILNSLALSFLLCASVFAQDAGTVRYEFPVRLSENSQAFSYGTVHDYFDHDPATPGYLQDWACGTRTYDRLAGGYDHAGTDFFLLPFPWDMLDAGDVEVVAVAAGEVVDLRSGEFDRECSWDGSPGSDDYNRRANFVQLRHADGSTTLYAHLAAELAHGIEMGAMVEAGQILGTVATSGYTSYPHLHFEPWTAEGVAFDPYEGVCSATPTRWRHQPAYQNTVVNHIETHTQRPYVPTLGLNICHQTDREEYVSDRFQPGDTVHIGIGLSDYYTSTRGTYQVLRPDGSVFATQSSEMPSPANPVSRWNTGLYDLFSVDLPESAPAGTWRIRADINGQVWERGFFVGISPGETRIGAAVLPSSRSISSGDPLNPAAATAFATVVNTGSETAHACGVYADRPIDGRLDFYTTDPATNAVNGARNANFNIPPGGQQTLLLAFTPNYRARADSWALNFRYLCRNARRARQISGVNSLLLSFGPAAVPDLIAVAVTPSGDGILRIADENSAAAFAMAVSNVGAAGMLTVRPVGLGSATTLRLRICETDPVSGVCLAPPTEAVSHAFADNETASFAVFVRAQGEAVDFAPATSRIQLIAEDAGGIIRGATSVAVQTH
ncbi:MAG: peptidoglycan DD-metalloendopeptidase family protein [Alphaproteobacteria bacterium]|nr:peptidoglycan DD-metalloendopeptidase family protein [Alphaproteobacteria bacterium]